MTPTDVASRRERVFMVVAVVAAFCSSACLFLLKLIAGKYLLPQFGGAPGVWNSCLAFFQLSLVAAYWYADHVIRTLSPRIQILVQSVLFFAAWGVTTLGLGATLVARPEAGLPLAVVVMAFLAVRVGPVWSQSQHGGSRRAACFEQISQFCSSGRGTGRRWWVDGPSGA